MEALTTILLVGLVLGAIASLLHNTFRTLRFQNAKVASQQASQIALHRICCEAREASALVQASSSTLILRKVEPFAGRLQDPPTPVPSTWDPYARVSTVTYSLDADGRLIRAVTPSVGAATSAIVAEHLVGFGVSEVSPGTLEVALSIQEEMRVDVLRTSILMGCYGD
jgi:hypothetical protein